MPLHHWGCSQLSKWTDKGVSQSQEGLAVLQHLSCLPSPGLEQRVRGAPSRWSKRDIHYVPDKSQEQQLASRKFPEIFVLANMQDAQKWMLEHPPRKHVRGFQVKTHKVNVNGLGQSLVLGLVTTALHCLFDICVLFHPLAKQGQLMDAILRLLSSVCWKAVFYSGTQGANKGFLLTPRVTRGQGSPGVKHIQKKDTNRAKHSWGYMYQQHTHTQTTSMKTYTQASLASSYLEISWCCW